MNNLLTILHNLSLDDNKNQDIYINGVFIDLVEIIYMLKNTTTKNSKKILFEAYCYNIKKIIDIYKELNDNIFLLHLNKIRNILTHDVVSFNITDDGIYFHDHIDGSQIYYNKYYTNKDNTINILMFMSYYILLISRELKKFLPQVNFSGLQINNSQVSEGLLIISKYDFKLNSLHDEYIELINTIYIRKDNKIIDDTVEDAKYIEDNIKAMNWFKTNSISLFQVDYMHTQISLGIAIVNSNKTQESIRYLKNSIKIIDDIINKYPFVWIFKIHIFNALSQRYFNLNDKSNAYEYALKCIKLLDTNLEVTIYQKIIYNTTFANALSIYNPTKEKEQLEKCIKLIILAEENDDKSILEYKSMVFCNYINSCNQFNYKINNEYIDYLLSFQKEPITKETLVSFREALLKYYYNNQNYDEAFNLIDILSKKRFLDKKKIFSLNFYKLILKFKIKDVSQTEIQSMEKKITKSILLSEDEKIHFRQELEIESNTIYNKTEERNE